MGFRLGRLPYNSLCQKSVFVQKSKLGETWPIWGHLRSLLKPQLSPKYRKKIGPKFLFNTVCKVYTEKSFSSSSWLKYWTGPNGPMNWPIKMSKVESRRGETLSDKTTSMLFYMRSKFRNRVASFALQDFSLMILLVVSNYLLSRLDVAFLYHSI